MVRKTVQQNPLVKVTPVGDTRAYNAALASLEIPAEVLEQRAREVARKFGVDENLPPRERCMAIVRAFRRAGGIGGGYRARMREPGED